MHPVEIIILIVVNGLWKLAKSFDSAVELFSGMPICIRSLVLRVEIESKWQLQVGQSLLYTKRGDFAGSSSDPIVYRHA